VYNIKVNRFCGEESSFGQKHSLNLRLWKLILLPGRHLLLFLVYSSVLESAEVE
jgi:hypothetical protein